MKQLNFLLLLLAVLGLPLGVWAQTNRGFDYYYKIGNEFLQKDSAKKALTMFDSAILLNHKSAEAYAARAKTKAKYFSLEDACKDYDEAISYAPKNEELKYFEAKEESLSGSCYFVLEPGPSAITTLHHGSRYDKIPPKYIVGIFDQAINKFPDSSKTYVDRSDYYFRQAKFSEAIEDAKKAVKIEPSPEN